MITEPTEPQRASRHPYSTRAYTARGLSLRVLLLGAMLASLAIAMTGGQPVGASFADGRSPASDSALFADGEPVGDLGTSGQDGPLGGVPADGTASGQASEDPAGGIVPTASVSPGTAGGGSASDPPADWHLYHHWADPSWPATPTTGTPSPDGQTPTPGYSNDPAPGTPTGAPTPTGPAPDPTGTDGQPDTPDVGVPPSSPGSPGPAPQDDTAGPGAGALPPPTGEPLPRDPLAASPDGEDLGLGETVDEPTPTPEPTPSAPAVPLRAAPADMTSAGEYQQTLIYSGLIGLALAAIGLTMVGMRRRHW